MRTPTRRIFVSIAIAVLATATWCTAEIVRRDLSSMVAVTDDAFLGTILGREVIRIDHETDGQALFFTHLTLEGRSLVDGEKGQVTVTYPGGFIDDETGVFNSEAPSEDDVKTGNQVVVFIKNTENMGGGLAAKALCGSHGGLFRTAQGKRDTIVLGRGDGYAIDTNTKLKDLDARVTKLFAETHKRDQGR